MAKAFLAATAQGYTWAAEHPSEAAQILVKQAQEDFKDTPLPEPLDPDMVAQSQILVSKVCIAGASVHTKAMIVPACQPAWPGFNCVSLSLSCI